MHKLNKFKKNFLRYIRNDLLNNQKVKFVINAFAVWISTQVALHVSLLFFSIPLSVFISICFYIPLGYFFYGKNVFGLNKFSKESLKRFIILTLLTLLLNTIGTSIVHSLGVNKNLSALIITPFLATISYLMQKYYVFKSFF